MTTEASGASARHAVLLRALVTSFSEPRRNRMVMLVETDPDLSYRQMTHELTHIFAFDVIPRPESQGRRVPTWVDEGLAEYMTGVWDPRQLSQLRDLVASDRLPRMSALSEGADVGSFGGTADLGHAAFEFVEAEFGKAAVWQFLLEVRRSVIDSGGDFYRATFDKSPAEFDSAFAEYLKRRFSL